MDDPRRPDRWRPPSNSAGMHRIHPGLVRSDPVIYRNNSRALNSQNSFFDEAPDENPANWHSVMLREAVEYREKLLRQQRINNGQSLLTPRPHSAPELSPAHQQQCNLRRQRGAQSGSPASPSLTRDRSPEVRRSLKHDKRRFSSANQGGSSYRASGLAPPDYAEQISRPGLGEGNRQAEFSYADNGESSSGRLSHARPDHHGHGSRLRPRESNRHARGPSHLCGCDLCNRPTARPTGKSNSRTRHCRRDVCSHARGFDPNAESQSSGKRRDEEAAVQSDGRRSESKQAGRGRRLFARIRCRISRMFHRA